MEFLSANRRIRIRTECLDLIWQLDTLHNIPDQVSVRLSGHITRSGPNLNEAFSNCVLRACISESEGSNSSETYKIIFHVPSGYVIKALSIKVIRN